MKHTYIGREWRPGPSMFDRRDGAGAFSRTYPDLGRDGEKLQAALIGGKMERMDRAALEGAIFALVVAAIAAVLLVIFR